MNTPTATPQSVVAGITRTAVLRVAGPHREQFEDEVAVEEPLQICLSGEPLAVTMRTPGRDHELVAGFLFAEGLIGSPNDLFGMAHCGQPGQLGAKNVMDVTPAPGAISNETFTRAERQSLTSSSCGICGRATIDDLVSRLGPREDDTRFDSRWLADLPEALARAQLNFARTGALHAAGAAFTGGELSVVREDVGRHNAVDKVIGRLLLDGAVPVTRSALVVSGRASFEIVQKALRAGFSAIVCVSAPSSLAIETAERFGLLLLGFVRGGAYNVYAGVGRIT